STVLSAQFRVGDAPLVGTAIESAHTAPGHHDVKLVIAHVETDIDCLHDHGFTGQGSGTWVTGCVVRLTGELQLIATAAHIATGGGGITVGESIAYGKGRQAITGVSIATFTAAASIQIGQHLIVRAAAFHRFHAGGYLTGPATVRFTAAREASRVAVAAATDRAVARAGRTRAAGNA